MGSKTDLKKWAKSNEWSLSHQKPDFICESSVLLVLPHIEADSDIT